MRALILASAFALVACGGSNESTEGTPSGDDAAVDSFVPETGDDTAVLPDTAEPEIAADTGPIKPVWDVNADKRKSCVFALGSKTTETIGPAVPHGDALPFKHVIFLMQENRSFDHYLSKLPEYGVTDVDVAKDTDTNPDPSTGKPIKRYHESRYCIVDTAHNWSPVHLQYDDGLMDGFVMTSNPGGARAMGYYDQTDLPFYYWMAKTFAISDRHFCSLLGPTWPNRFFFYGATSWGRTHTPDTPPLGKPKITDQLDSAGKKWKIYRNGLSSFGLVFGPSYAGTDFDNFAKDVAADKLPELSIIDPNFGATVLDGIAGASGVQDDEHPPANIQRGQLLAKRVLDALASNPTVWKKSVFIIAYDEHGGFYDHVVPPEACEPDGDRPPDYKFDRLGIRTPLFIASPWTKPGYVSHVTTDLTSITRFIQNRWDLPALTRRDANAWPLLDFFDFSKVSFETVPSGAPSADPTAAGLDWCKKNTAGTGLP